MNKVVFFCMVCLLTTKTLSVYATDINLLDPGDAVYKDGGVFSDDERYTVIRVDKASGKVKVRDGSGNTDFFDASYLYTKSEMEYKNSSRNFGIGAVLAIGACAASGACGSSE